MEKYDDGQNNPLDESKNENESDLKGESVEAAKNDNIEKTSECEPKEGVFDEDFDLEKLKSSDLKSFPYTKILVVIKKLEKVFMKDFSIVDAREKLDSYYVHAVDIRNMIEMDKFKDDLSTPSQKENLLSRVENIIFNFSVLFKISVLSAEQVENFEEKAKKIEEKIRQNSLDTIRLEKEQFNSNINKIHNGLKEEIADEIFTQKRKIALDFKKIHKGLKKDITDEFESQKQNIDKLEHTTLSHVLSLMGIFSAVIVIIMSVILTATSWLNNADGASAIVAFTVPNLVALLSVFVLLSLIYLYTHKDSSVGENSDKRTKIKSIFAIVVIAIILVISITLSIVLVKSINKVKEENIPHKQYVISLTDYKIIEIENSEKVKEKFFEVFLDGERYEFKYDEKYIHDGDRLYFCKEHNTLE